MKLEAYQTLHCDAGWRRFSFLKLIAEDGTTGISEYNECYGSPGLTGVIEGVLEWIIGKNPFSHEKLSAELYARTRQAHGGIAQQAIAAVENALVDLKARSLGVPVYELLGKRSGKNFLFTGHTVEATGCPEPPRCSVFHR